MTLPYKTKLDGLDTVVRVIPDKWLGKSSQRYLKKQYKENSTMAKKEKVEFSKFFPQSTSFVVVTGSAEGSDDFGISVEIGDGSDKVSFYLSDWIGNKDGLASLKAVQDGIQKAIDFYGKALNLPKVEDFPIVSNGVKKAATKKKTTKK
jgi:hypothetical protein